MENDSESLHWLRWCVFWKRLKGFYDSSSRREFVVSFDEYRVLYQKKNRWKCHGYLTISICIWYNQLTLRTFLLKWITRVFSSWKSISWWAQNSCPLYSIENSTKPCQPIPWALAQQTKNQINRVHLLLYTFDCCMRMCVFEYTFAFVTIWLSARFVVVALILSWASSVSSLINCCQKSQWHLEQTYVRYMSLRHLGEQASTMINLNNMALVMVPRPTS